MRLGQLYGLLSTDPNGVRLAPRYVESLCSEAERFATTDVDRFLEEGWIPLHISAAGKAKTVTALESDFIYFVSEASGEPLASYLADVGRSAKVLSANDDILAPSPDLVAELIEMAMAALQTGTLEGVPSIPAFTLRSLADLVSARLILATPESVGHTHLLSLFVYSVFATEDLVGDLMRDFNHQSRYRKPLRLH